MRLNRFLDDLLFRREMYEPKQVFGGPSLPEGNVCA